MIGQWETLIQNGIQRKKNYQWKTLTQNGQPMENLDTKRTTKGKL